MKPPLKTTLTILISIIILIALISLATYILTNNSQTNQQTDKHYQNQAQEIIDGDTFTLITGEKVRLLCVDTPEKGEQGYDEAVSFLGGRILYEDLVLEGNETDRYGRLLRWVWVEGELINKEIVEGGLGEVFEYEGEDCSMMMMMMME